MIIKQINSIDTISIRHAVLRKGKPIETCIFDNDDLATTKHFGLYENKSLIGVASFYENRCEDLNVTKQFQLRGMAILEEYQEKGFGCILLSESEKNLTNEKKFLIWCNARISAVPFYEKLGYTIIGTAFEILNIGTHYKMYKNISV